MTSGTKGNLNIYSPLFYGSNSHKVWSGGDGKVGTFAGSPCVAWNNYVMRGGRRTRSSPNFVLQEWRNQSWPNPGHNYDSRVAFVFALIAMENGFGQKLEFTSSDQLKLLNKLTSKVKSHDFNLAVNLGQMRQTTDLLVGNLQKLGRAALSLRRGRFGDASRHLFGSKKSRPRASKLEITDVSGRWLELQYGWKPLLQDSYEACQAFASISEGPRTSRFRVSIKKSGYFEGSQSPSLYSLMFSESLQRVIQYECIEELTPQRQLGLLDPLSVAWELTPWSFVIDWFIPMGSYLEAMNQVPALKGRFLTSTVRRRETSDPPEWKGTLYPSAPPPNGVDWGYKLVGFKPDDQFQSIELDRVYSTSLTPPLPSFNFGGAVHGRRLWNAISLAHQRFSGDVSPPPRRRARRIAGLFRGSDFVG